MNSRILGVGIVLSLLIANQCCTAITISLYYETLCHDSQKFIKEQLHRAFEWFGDQIKLELIPFGNVEEYNDTKGVLRFHCQHGVEECRGNKLQSCVYTKYWSISELHRKAIMNFIVCMFDSGFIGSSVEEAAKECVAKYLPGLWPAISYCYREIEGRDIYRMMARKTRILYPSPSYVPWVTIDGKYDKQWQSMAESDLIQLICAKANPRPSKCVNPGAQQQMQRYINDPYSPLDL